MKLTAFRKWHVQQVLPWQQAIDMQSLYALIVMYLNNVVWIITQQQKKQTNIWLCFIWFVRIHIAISTQTLFLFNTQIYQWSWSCHFIFPVFVCFFKSKLNILWLLSQYWNTQTRSNLWISADWVVKMFCLWEELKAPKKWSHCCTIHVRTKVLV